MKRTRTHYTSEQREKILAEYRAGTTGAAEFAADRRIRLATLRTWLSRHPGAGRGRGFVAVETKPAPPPTTIEIEVGEVRVRIREGASSEFVADLVMRLAGGSC